MGFVICPVRQSELQHVDVGTDLFGVCDLAVSKMEVGKTGTLFACTAIEYSQKTGRLCVRYTDWGPKYDAWLTNIDLAAPQVFQSRQARDAWTSAEDAALLEDAKARATLVVAEAKTTAENIVAAAQMASACAKMQATEAAREIVAKARSEATTTERVAYRAMISTVVGLAIEQAKCESAVGTEQSITGRDDVTPGAPRAQVPHSVLLADNHRKRKAIDELKANNTHLRREVNRLTKSARDPQLERARRQHSRR